jgi:hypothetical protein
VRHQTKPAVPRAGAARLTPTNLQEGSKEVRVNRYLPNNFTKGDKSAFALAWNHHLNQGNRLMKAKLRI